MSSHRSVALMRTLASTLYRHPLPLFETLNHHARLRRWLLTQDAQRFEDRFALHSFIHDRFVGGSRIDYLEFGVFRGESFAHWLGLNRNADSRFYGFDTFSGLPTDWNPLFRRGHFDVGGEAPAFDDPRGRFVKGLFQETLPTFLSQFRPGDGQLVIHNDSDLYSSTVYTLASLNHLIRPGTILIFDEFASPMHEWRAWNDFCGAFMRKAELLAYTGVYATQAAFRFVE